MFPHGVRFAATGFNHPTHEPLKPAGSPRAAHQPYDPWPAGPSSRARSPSDGNHRLTPLPPAVASRRLPVSTVNTPPPIDMHAPPPDLVVALRRVGTIFALGVLPVAALVTMFAVGLAETPSGRRLPPRALPGGEAARRVTTPSPRRTTTHRRREPRLATGRGLPGLAPHPLPAGVADVLMLLIGLVCFALALWLVGLRDWRVYGLVALWPQVRGRDARLAPDAGDLPAARARLALARQAVRTRGRARVRRRDEVLRLAASACGSQPRGASRDAALAAAVAGASLLLVLPLRASIDYATRSTRLGRGFDQDSYTLFGLLVQTGSSEAAARIVMSSSASCSSQRPGATGASRSRSPRP